MKQFSEACTGWKEAFIYKKTSMETKHPLSPFVFGLSKPSEKPTITAAHIHRSLLDELFFQGIRDGVASPQVPPVRW